VATEGGGQARRLRARSFFIQTLAEAALVRILRISGQTKVHFCAAGKFVVESRDLPHDAVDAIQRERIEIGLWLLRATGGQVRFSLVWHQEGKGAVADYTELMQLLQREKLRPWTHEVVQGGRWDPSRLMLDPMDTPCQICRQAKAECDQISPEGEHKRVCHRCSEDYQLGRILPSAKWMSFHSEPGSFHVAGLGMELQADGPPSPSGEILAVANLEQPEAGPGALAGSVFFIKRHLAAHVPYGPDGQPLSFAELAELSTGDKLLGVIKADGDRMGCHFSRLLQESGWDGLSQGAQAIDGFFGGLLNREMARPRSPWNSLYTVFSGGDDLLLVGPWDIGLDFVGHVRELFVREFSPHDLTLSAGIALIKPTWPIRAAVEQAEELLEQAKDAGRDRIAALGQVWQWDSHAAILQAGRRVTSWVNDGAIRRSWLHTLLELTELRLDIDKPTHECLRATSRLAYHVARNWPAAHDRDETRRAARSWADDLVKQFDQINTGADTDIRLLPATLRYALIATRRDLDE